MKTVGTILAVAFALLPWCSSALLAQNTSSNGEKKIVITKRTLDADGTETTETIVKKGKAAENFDVDQYIKDNTADNVQLDVRVKGGDDGDDRTVIINRNKNKNHKSRFHNDDEFTWTMSNDDNRAFLGVEEDSDEDGDQPGLVVEIVRGSAAEKAGLRTNDVILQLNGAAVNKWDELSKIIGVAKPGDQLQIAYSRNGKPATATATLTKRNEVKCDPEACKHGFLGITSANDDNDVNDNNDVNDDNDNNDVNDNNTGVVVDIVDNSAAAKAGLKDGDVLQKLNDTEIRDWEDITDFMTYTKPGEKVNITYQRNGQTNTAAAVLGEQKTKTWSGVNWEPKDFNIKIREKEACLGVYSSSYDAGDQQGTRVSDFTKESAAREADMSTGDIITAVNGVQVKGHDELWDQIAQYKPGDKVKVDFLRESQPRQIEATLKACRDNSNHVVIFNDEDGVKSREFFLWNWEKEDQNRLREQRIITIRRGAEGDAPKVETPAANIPTQDRALKLEGFQAYPNPSAGQVTVKFQGEPQPIVVSLLDLSGRQLFREELNAFNGDYFQQFDLMEYAKGTIIIHVQQGEKVFTEQIIVN